MNIGDKIKVVNDHNIWLTSYELPEDTILTIIDDTNDDTGDWINPDDLTIEIDAVETYQNDFEKVVDNYFSGVGLGVAAYPEHDDKPDTIPHLIEQLGMYRPNLSDRKIGKVRVELVDKGFPNALWELAKLMTWAQEAKGYKDHDWKNLPDAKNSLPAAASRHRQQHNRGEFYDDESKLYHKVSEAFGVLAELELILTGVIKL